MERSAKKQCIRGNEGTAGGASGAHTSTEGDGTATSSRCDYEVFLSFRGPDTRATFTDHLCTRLKDVGIRVFKDDEDLRKGDEFGPELLQAIKQSKILVPIFSKDYATSVWCLKEVVQMVECRKKTGGQKIVPIFYDVAPSEVRYQTGGYGEAFLLHDSKKRYDQKTIGEWKAALSAVGEINGNDLQSMPNRREGEFVKKFTREVFSELKKASLAESEYLVGVDNHVVAIMEKIGAGTSETRIIGIHGMGGIGKTTIAKIIFNKFSHDFENCCFLRDIRETSKTSGIQCLQKQLISSILKMECADIKDIKDVHEGTQTIKNRLSDKRVLLLLDDVEEGNHIDALVCKRDWLGEGSKIIITTRRIDVLYVPEVDDRYELTGMDPDQSLQLFSKHAFRRDSPLDEYIDLANRAIGIAGGVPLALEVIASLLSRAKKEMWDARLKMLESVLDDKIQSTLKISYDTLDFRQQHMFLDIACLFIGYDKDILVHFWAEPDFFPEVAMEDLQNMSLIKIDEDNEVWMHDLLRDFGREMVRQESNKKIVKQSRVWDPKVGSDLLRKHKGKKEVEALRLKWGHEPQCRFTYEGFENLSDLRFLEVDGGTEKFHAEERLLWHESPSNVLPTNENSDLLPYLRWLSWSDFPPTFNIANFFVEDLVILNLSRSEITHDWKGWSHMKVMKNLKVLNLSKCPKLERLPDELGRYLASLEYLSLNSCGSLKRLPDSIGNMESLIELDISGTGIKELPDSIRKLKNLKRLKSLGWIYISKIPDALWTIEKLEEIEVVKNCETFHVNIGNCIYKNQSLRILRLHQADIIALPRLPESLVTLRLGWLYMDTFPDLSNLTNLKELDLRFRSRESHEESDGPLEEYPIPRWIGNLSKLESLNLTSPYVTTSPTDLTLPPHLKELHLDCPKLESLCLCSPCVTASPTDLTLPPHLSLHLYNCRNLRRLPRLPSSLSSLCLGHCDSLCSTEDLDLSSPQLKELRLESCLNLRRLPRLPSSLSSLHLYDCSMEDLDLSSPQLKELHLQSCPNLRRLPRLSSSLSFLCLSDCDSLCWMESLELVSPYVTTSPTDLTLPPHHLKEIQLLHCPNLRHLPRLPSSLSSLSLYECKSLCSMEDLSNLKNLSSLFICFAAIEEIQGLGCLENLRDLTLSYLGQLKILPDLSNLNKLTSLEVKNCDNLVEIQGEVPRFLDKLRIDSCDSLQNLPDLSSLMVKQEATIRCCSKLNVEAILGFARINTRDLQLLGFGQLQILPDLSNSSELRRLEVCDCHNLVEIQGELPESLEVLVIHSCQSLPKLPDLSSLKEMQKVNIKGCKELKGEAILGSARRSQANLWENLQYLQICGLEQMEILPDLSNLIKLRSLTVKSCDNLVEIQGELPESLEVLEISSCINIQKLPDLTGLNGLRTVKIYRCFGLNVEAISSLCSEKSLEFVEDDRWVR